MGNRISFKTLTRRLAAVSEDEGYSEAYSISELLRTVIDSGMDGEAIPSLWLLKIP